MQGPDGTSSVATARPSAAPIVRVTFFVSSNDETSSSGRPTLKSSGEVQRTQVWLSLALDATTTPRDVIVHAFRHAIQRLGGAKMDAHPTRMLIFLQSHGEFIKLDDHKKPLLSYDPVVELIQREGKRSITTALLSDVEYRRYNKDEEIANIAQSADSKQQSSTSSTFPNVLPSHHHGDAGASQQPNGEQHRLSPTSLPSSAGSFQFRGRNRAGSILPEALGHDPLGDQRIPRNKLKNATSPTSHALHDLPVTEDSFLLPDSHALQLDPRQKGSCDVFFVTPTGRKLRVTVEYPLGALGGEVVDRAVELLRHEASVQQCEWELSTAFLDHPEALTLLYQRQDNVHRRFGRDDVLPISRGNRSEGTVQLFLCVDRERLLGASSPALAASSARSPPRSPRGAAGGAGGTALAHHRRRSNSVAASPFSGTRAAASSSFADGSQSRALSRSDVLRVVGHCSDIQSYVVAAATDDEETVDDASPALLPYSEVPPSQLELFYGFEAQDVLHGVPENCVPNAERLQHQLGNDPAAAAVVRSLLKEETESRLNVAKGQVRVKMIRRDIAELMTACDDVAAEEEALSAKCMELQKTIGEAKGAERDIARLQDLMTWFARDVDAAKERHRELTKQLFTLERN